MQKRIRERLISLSVAGFRLWPATQAAVRYQHSRSPGATLGPAPTKVGAMATSRLGGSMRQHLAGFLPVSQEYTGPAPEPADKEAQEE